MSRFYKPTKYNGDTKTQMWMSMISDGHDMHCSCHFPFAHLLESIFPEGHQDRHHSIEFIIRRDLQQCHSGGQEEENHGIQLGESAATLREREDQDIKEDIDDLILAAAAAAEEKER